MVKCPTHLSFKEGQIPHPPGMLKQQCKSFFPCVKLFIEMYIFWNKQLATVLVVLRHTFTYKKKLIQQSRIMYMYVSKDNCQKISCKARRFKQSQRAEKAAKLRKLALKPQGACCLFSRLCSFVTVIRLLKTPSDAGYQKKEKL